jgi:hypothetical protein
LSTSKHVTLRRTPGLTTTSNRPNKALHLTSRADFLAAEADMKISRATIDRAVAAQPLGSEEPFLSGPDEAIASFYKRVFAALERSRIRVLMEPDHHGSGYASYISTFLYRADGVGVRDFPAYRETAGLLLYVSRLAPVAVFGASDRTQNHNNTGSSSGFIRINNLNKLPGDDWADFLWTVKRVLHNHGVELLATEPLLEPAPEGLRIPTAFDGPYYVFDTLFYWED